MQEVHLLGAEGKKTWCRWPIFSALFGAAAAWLFQTRTDRLRRRACIFGMLGKPASGLCRLAGSAVAHFCRMRHVLRRLGPWRVGALDCTSANCCPLAAQTCRTARAGVADLERLSQIDDCGNGCNNALL